MPYLLAMPECIYNRYLLRIFECLAHPNQSATFATDQKWPICHLRISYQSLAGSLRSLKKSEFLKMIISFFHYFWCQNGDQWNKMSGKNTHIRMFYFWFNNKRVWAEKIGKKQKNSKNLKVAGNYPISNSHLFFKFFTWKIKIINFYYSNFWGP